MTWTQIGRVSIACMVWGKNWAKNGNGDNGFSFDSIVIYGITVIGGTGMGLMFSSTIIALQAAVETKDIGKCSF